MTKPIESNNIKLPMYFNLNESSPIGKINETDFSMLLHLSYPNGSLIANDIIYVNVTAILDDITESLKEVTLAFPNSLRYPIDYLDNGLPKQGILTFLNPINIGSGVVSKNNKVIADMNITFPIEGAYRPIIGLKFKDNSTHYFEAKNTILHVYPEEELTQQEINRYSLESDSASLDLSIAVLVLSLFTMIALWVQIVDKDCDDDKKQHNPKHKCPYLEDKAKKQRKAKKPKKKTK